ncbi:hypothetical protein D3C85_1536880 [compost metagenome]
MKCQFESIGYCGIVDVLRSQSEVDKLFVILETQFIKLLFDEIFYRFDIVVGDFFSVFDLLSMIIIELFMDHA